MPFALFKVSVVLHYTYDLLPVDRKFFAILGTILYTALMALNFYWLVLISRGVGKMLGCIKSSKSKDNFEKVNEAEK